MRSTGLKKNLTKSSSAGERKALLERENKLLSIKRQAALLERSLELSRDAERRYEVQYRAGAVALKSWLDAQKTRRDAELALAENRYARLDNRVTLYQALGGTVPAGNGG